MIIYKVLESEHPLLEKGDIVYWLNGKAFRVREADIPWDNYVEVEIEVI